MQKNMESERDNGYSHVLKYTGIFGGVQGLNILISLVRNKVVASILGPGGMGLVALFNSVITFISQATNLGVSFSAVRHVSELYDEGGGERLEHFVKIVRGWSLLTALVGMLVCVVAGPLLRLSLVVDWVMAAAGGRGSCHISSVKEVMAETITVRKAVGLPRWSSG